MRVGMIGLGKLGLPVAYAMASRGLEVYGYDPFVVRSPQDTSHEEGLAETIQQAEGRMYFCGPVDVVNNADVIFVAVQTPHEPRFEGITPLPDDRADFEYGHLREAVRSINKIALSLDKDVTLAVISTVLPGTMEREILPLLSERVSLVYNPSFIAMGTTIRDFLDPEFVLLGGDAECMVEPVYAKVLDPTGPDRKRIVRTTVENAELIKVAYNTFIGLKLAFANTLMEVCHKTGCDVDEVTGALKLAHRRLISPAYMDGGMGDGGGCHPRDNIALSWLARELDLSFDLFEATMLQREKQAEWLADLMDRHGFQALLPKVILGTAYKPGSRITTGSPALLVKSILEKHGQEVQTYDPIVERQPIHDELPASFDYPAVFLVGCRHPNFTKYRFPKGSVVIDPWRYMPYQPGVEVIRLGECAAADDGQTGEGGGVRQIAA